MSRARGFCFTSFRVNDDTRDWLATLGASASVTYLTYGREICPTTGNPHFQGYIYFANNRHLNAVIKMFRPDHIEIAKTIDQAITYCHKDGDFVEFGKRPRTFSAKDKKDSEVRWELAKQGRFEELPPEQIRVYEYINNKYSTVEARDELLNIWISGPSGCGKSKYIRTHYPDHYWKGMSKWWDGYNHEAVTVLDDFDPSHGDFLGYYLKIWTDHYPFNAEVKGGMFQIRPGMVIVTSQYPLEACFRLKDGSPNQETIAALSRRFTRFNWQGDLLNGQFVKVGTGAVGPPLANYPAINADLDELDFDPALFDDDLL